MTADGRLASAHMLALATELAPRLGIDWSAIPDPYDHNGAACLVRPDGAEIFLEPVRWPPAGKGRLNVVGRYPRSEDGKVYGPTGKRIGGRDRASITVALERGVEAIARDIALRFLPEYLEGLRQTQADIAEHVEELREAERTAIRIAVAAGTTPERWGGGKEWWCVRVADGLIKVRDSHRDGPHIEIRLDGVDGETAERVARALRPLEEVVREVFREPDTKSDVPVPIPVAIPSGRSHTPLMNTTTSAATMARATKAAKVITIRDLKDRDWTKFGHTHAGRVDVGQHAEITVGVSIRLFGSYKSYPYNKELSRSVETDVAYDRTFAIGDTAEYDSYNMHYLGSVTAIGEKTITITDGSKVRRLSIFDFAHRNHDLDLEAISARNSDVMMSC